MNPETLADLFRKLKYFLVFILLVASPFFIMGANFHSTIIQKSSPNGTGDRETTTLVPIVQPTPHAATVNNIPFVHVEPDSKGEAVIISLDSDQALPGVLYANLGIGPTGDKHSWTLPYSDTKKSHIQTIPFAASNTIGSVNITSTVGLKTDDIQFKRAFVKAQAGSKAESVDTALTLELNNADTLTNDTYMVVTTNRGQPGPLNPETLTLLGPSYSIRPAGQILTTPKPMTLVYRYSAVVGNADPRTMDIYHWENNQWEPLGAEHLPTQQAFSARINQFGAYVLAAAPRWHANFADLNLTSLDGDKSKIKRGGTPDHWVLTLKDKPGSGSAVSVPITPTFGLESWGVISYTAAMTPPTTTLTVDVLSITGAQLLTHVVHGQSLAAIDPIRHPALRLRVNMSANATGDLPTLKEWSVTWLPPRPGRFTVGNGAITVGGAVTVPLTLDETPAAGLGGATLEVGYDPALLHATGCAIAAPAHVTVRCNSANDAADQATAVIRLSLLVSPALTSPVPLAQLTFQAVGWSAAGATLEVTAPIAIDAGGEPVTILTQNGLVRFTNQPAGDVNCDQQVDMQDVGLILDYSVGLRQSASICPPPAAALFLPQCDLTGDGLCDVRDAQEILTR